MNEDVEEFIKHHGVRGMKWGVRKAPRRVSSDAKKLAPLRKKKSFELSNKQLKALNDRQQLESTHRRNNPSKLTKALALKAQGKMIYLEGAAAVASVAAAKAYLKSDQGKAMMEKVASQVNKRLVKKGAQAVSEQLTLF